MAADEHDDQPLNGGIANAGAIVRRGDLVRRPTGPHTATVQRFRADLRAQVSRARPSPAGMTNDGRERLGFIPGDVAVPPYPAWAQIAEGLASIARLMRGLHDAAARVGVPMDGWNRELADPAGGPIVCHNDVCLENVVFRDGEAAFVERLDRLGGPQRFERRRRWGSSRREELRVRPRVRITGLTLPQLHEEVADMNLGAPELLNPVARRCSVRTPGLGHRRRGAAPVWAWQQSGQNQTLWIVLMVVGLFMCVVGVALALVYLLAIRPQVASQQIGGPHPGPPPPPPSVPLALAGLARPAGAPLTSACLRGRRVARGDRGQDLGVGAGRGEGVEAPPDVTAQQPRPDAVGDRGRATAGRIVKL